MSEVTAEVLEKVAERLGWQELSKRRERDSIYETWSVAKDTTAGLAIGERLTCGQRIGSDGDLLLAILNKAAEMGWDRLSDRHSMGAFTTFTKTGFDGELLNSISGESPAGNELEAAMLAFAQLEPPHD